MEKKQAHKMGAYEEFVSVQGKLENVGKSTTVVVTAPAIRTPESCSTVYDQR
jgi:hypothetical protein